MSNTYTDIQIIECNRNHSEEAKSGNDTNYSLWTNNLQDIVHLEPGDKVSVHGAMISERGAGQSSSIEIKGQSLGFTQTLKHTILDSRNASDDIPSGYEKIFALERSRVIEVRDDTANFVISYYINMNGHNVMSLPRRWWYNESKGNQNFLEEDDRVTFGMSLADPFLPGTYSPFVLFDDYYQISGQKGYGEVASDAVSGYLTKVKHDNSRFTLMVRDVSYYSEESASGNLVQQAGTRDPENSTYFMYKELKTITVPKGFNSPDYLSEEITRQLQKVNERKTRFTRNATDRDVDNKYRPGHPIPMYQEFNAETYKAFNVGGFYAPVYSGAIQMPHDFSYYINGSSISAGNNGSGYEYLSQYHIVACKRPELYEYGRLINTAVNGDYNGIFGCQLASRFDGSEHNGNFGININTPYTKEAVERWRDFFYAQELYPEIWNQFSDPRTGYNSGDTIDNSRWFHMNRYKNASMLNDNNQASAMLGWGGYLRPSWAGQTDNLISLLVPFQYDASQRDIYYENPDESLGQRSFGCIGKNNQGDIILFPTTNNGSGSALFNLLNAGGDYIETTRKCGYDMHFNSPGNPWAMPLSGTAREPVAYDPRGAQELNYTLAANSNIYTLQTYNYNKWTGNLRNKLYIGADAPKLNWDGTNFSFSNLHTSMNRGNNQSFEANYVDTVREGEPNAVDIVYKINPTEQYGDYTPDRKPYVENRSYTTNHGGTDKNAFTPVLNQNLQPWTIYDALSGINIEDFGLTEEQWTNTLWDLLGFTYKQFHSKTNNRLSRIDTSNVQDLKVITTNADVPEGATKFYSQSMYGVPLYNQMLQRTGNKKDKDNVYQAAYYPPLVVKTSSINIVAERLPTRMIRGYYTLRSNIITDTPFIGGKVNNTMMPIIGIVNKINGTGDFYTQEESSLEFTITKPLKLASLTCSVHDPDGSYANTTEENAILFKVQKNRNVTFNVVEEILQEMGQKKGTQYLESYGI